MIVFVFRPTIDLLYVILCCSVKDRVAEIVDISVLKLLVATGKDTTDIMVWFHLFVQSCIISYRINEGQGLISTVGRDRWLAP